MGHYTSRSVLCEISSNFLSFKTKQIWGFFLTHFLLVPIWKFINVLRLVVRKLDTLNFLWVNVFQTVDFRYIIVLFVRIFHVRYCKVIGNIFVIQNMKTGNKIQSWIAHGIYIYKMLFLLLF